MVSRYCLIFVFLSSCATKSVQIKPAMDSHSGHIAFEVLSTSSYVKACSANIDLFKKTPGNLEEVVISLPDPEFSENGYWIDSSFITPASPSSEGCDVIECHKLPAKTEITIPLKVFRILPSKPSPKNAAVKADAYKSIPLRGKFRLGFRFFKDSDCSKRESVSLEFDR